MKINNHRIQKISKELYKEISNIVFFKMKDPRLHVNINISGIMLSKDFSYARVFVSYLNEKDNLAIKNNLFILNNSVGFVKRNLRKKIKMRIIPQIIFVYDNSIVTGIKISKLLNNKK